MFTFLVGFAVSLLVTICIVRMTSAPGHLALDRDVSGPQKFHVQPVPRVGGAGILAGFIVALGFLWWRMGDQALLGVSLFLCGMPAFAGGIVEDITKRVSPAVRLIATAVSALLAFGMVGASIVRTDIPGLDWMVGFAVGRIAITVLAVAGLAHSVNIIDGFNGLASMCVVLILAALTFVAFQVGDSLIGALSLLSISAVLGFFVWNFPAGLIFLGDGGAYFLGFLVAELSILLLVRNPTVSPIFPLLVCIYPVFETVFSIYRRRILRDVPPSMPDGIHLHSLIYRRVIRWAMGGRGGAALTRRNSMTSPFLWALCMVSVVPSVIFWDNTFLLSLALCAFVVSYVMLYWRIVRFKAPRWMRALARRPGMLRESDNPGS